jgi:hypothetical protein
MIQKRAETKLMFKDLGGSIVYTPFAAPSTPVSSFGIRRLNSPVMDIAGAEVVDREDLMVLLRADIDRPKRDATIVYTDPEDSTTTTYLVDEIIKDDSHTVTVTIRKQ